jgi:hypothetical protein
MIYARVQDATVETDYRQAIGQIERRQMPLYDRPIAVDDWPTTQELNLPAPLDNSV